MIRGFAFAAFLADRLRGGAGLLLRAPAIAAGVMVFQAHATAGECLSCLSLHPAEPKAGVIQADPSAIAGLLTQITAEAVRASPSPLRQSSRPIGDAELTHLVQRCAPATPTSVIKALVAVESSGRPWLLSTNGTKRQVFSPGDLSAAKHMAHTLQTQRANFDVGLMQLNSKTLQRLGIAVGEALEPCRNIAIGAELFDRGYARALSGGSTSVPLLAAYSAYNTGDLQRGYSNGYANQVDAHLRASARTRGAPS